MQNQGQNSIYKVLKNYIPKNVLVKKNKARTWKYGYNNKYNLVIISKVEAVSLLTMPEVPIRLPKGRLGITFSRIGDETIISRVHDDSNLKGILEKNDHLYEVNGIELKHFNVNEITKIFKAGNNNERILKIMRPKNFF